MTPRPDVDPETPAWRRLSVRADGRRSWAGRPALLALGWALSCVLITAVTLTAVERVGREVSGSQDLLTANGITKQVAAQAASASSASSAAPQPVTSAPAGLPSRSPSATQPATSNRTAPVKPSTSATTAVAVAPTKPVSSPTPTKSATPPGTEYVFTCRDGKAVGGAVLPGTSPTPTPSASVSPVVSPNATPAPSLSTTPTPAPSPSPSPSASPSTSKSIIDVPGGRIVVACTGNSIANANATVSDSTYTLTVRSTSDPRVDVFFAKA